MECGVGGDENITIVMINHTVAWQQRIPFPHHTIQGFPWGPVSNLMTIS